MPIDNNLDRTKAPDIHAISDLSLSPLRHLTLDNGIKLHVLDRGSDEVNRLVALRAGGCAEAPDRPVGVLVSQLLCEGSDNMTGSEIADVIEFNGSWINASMHSHHQTLSMSSINSRFADVAPVMADIWHSPSFPTEPFEVKRAMLAKQAEELSLKVAAVADRYASQLIMGKDNPLAQWSSPERILSTELDDIKRFYTKCAHDAPTELYLAGRITPAIEDEVNKRFGQLPKPASAYGDGIVVTPFTGYDEGLTDTQFGLVKKVTVKDSLQSAVNIILPAIPRSHPDYIPLRLAVITLGGYFGSRLMTNIRENKGYTYGIGANLLGYLDGSYIQIAAECDNKYVDSVIEEVINELRALVTRKADNDEMMRVRQSVTSSLLSILDTPFSNLDYYMNMALVGTPADYFDRLLQASLTMTPDTIAEIAAKYLNPALMKTVIAGK